MPGVAVVTDTTHYLPRELADAEGVQQVSLYVNWPEGQERESDMPDFQPFYERLRTTVDLPTTSQPSIGDFLAVYEPLVPAGTDIVSIHLAGGISGTVESARQAAEQAGGRIEVIDSETGCGGAGAGGRGGGGTGCGGLGLVVLAAARTARDGASLDEVVSVAREARAGLKIWFAIDTLDYLQRGGRIGKAQAMLGAALKIKPILSLESEIVPVERVRTAGRAFERMVEYARSRMDDGADGWVVQHIQAPDQASRLVERGREIFGTDPVFVSEIGPGIGTHVGPGLIG